MSLQLYRPPPQYKGLWHKYVADSGALFHRKKVMLQLALGIITYLRHLIHNGSRKHFFRALMNLIFDNVQHN
jgi:hypothetical protein